MKPCVFVIFATACGGGDASPRVDPVAAAPTPAPLADAAVPHAGPDAGPARDAIAAQCERIADRYGRAVEPELQRRGLAKLPDLALLFRAKTNVLRSECRVAPPELRDCLERDPEILKALELCGLTGFEVRALEPVDPSKLVTYRKQSPPEQLRALANLVGHWTDARFHLALQIEADATMTTSFPWYGTTHFRLELDHAALMSAYYGSQFADSWTYAFLDDQTVSICVNTWAYQNEPRIGDDDVFVTRLGGEVLRFDRGRCTRAGKPLTCAIAVGAGGRKELRVKTPEYGEAVRWLLPEMFVDPACPIFQRSP